MLIRADIYPNVDNSISEELLEEEADESKNES